MTETTDVLREKNERLEQVYREARAKYLVANYEASREKIDSSFLKQVVERITEERNAALDMVKVISDMYSANATEKCNIEEKASSLAAVDKATIADLQSKLALSEDELQNKSNLVADLECKVSYAHKMLAVAEVQVKELQERNDEHDQKLADTENRVQEMKNELAREIEQRSRREEVMKKLEEHLEAEKKARLEEQNQFINDTRAAEEANTTAEKTLKNEISVLTTEKFQLSAALDAEKSQSAKRDAEHMQEISRMETEHNKITKEFKDSALKKVMEEGERHIKIQADMQSLVSACEKERTLRSEAEARLNEMAKSLESQTRAAKGDFEEQRAELQSVISLKDSLVKELESKVRELEKQCVELREEKETRMHDEAAMGLDSIVDTLMAPEDAHGGGTVGTSSRVRKPDLTPTRSIEGQAKRKRTSPADKLVEDAKPNGNLPRRRPFEQPRTRHIEGAGKSASPNESTIEIFHERQIAPTAFGCHSEGEQPMDQSTTHQTERILDQPLEALQGRTLDEILGRADSDMQPVARFPVLKARNKLLGKTKKRAHRG